MKYYATDKAPQAIGPYSQAVSRSRTVYTSGQIPLDPATAKLVEGTFEDMVERVFDNLEAVLASAGLGFSDVVKVNVFLTDMANFAALNGIYARRMGDHKPARSTIQVAALPMGALVEIDMTAEMG
jgi:2-iminobutanoate/2-iminopropanoate deaminase